MAAVRRWGPLLLWMGLIFLLSAQSQLPAPQPRWLDTFVEKSSHFLEYALLAALIMRALHSGRTWTWRDVGGAFAIAALYALSDEYHQSFVPGRTPDWSDILFDWLGAGAGVAACLLFWTQHRQSVADKC